MAAPYDALQIPPTAQERGGIEVLRAGVVDGGLHVMLRRAFNDPKAWGVLLADVARQVSSIYVMETGAEQQDILGKISEAFAAEMKSPSHAGRVGPAN
jgi:hypothetical protein